MKCLTKNQEFHYNIILTIAKQITLINIKITYSLKFITYFSKRFVYINYVKTLSIVKPAV
jgi:hypothetical protein